MNSRRRRFDIRQAGKPLLTILGIWFVVSLACYMTFVRPKVQQYQGLEFGSDSQRLALKSRENEIEKLERFHAALATAESDLDVLRSDVLSTRQRRMVQAELELATLCEEFGIDLDSVSFDNEQLPDEGLDKMTMIVPLQGGYTNLRKFLKAVEDSEKFLLVERVALAEGREGGVLLDLNITLATYFDLPKSEIGRKV